MEKLNSITLPLTVPVTVAGVTYETLTFRRMKARDALVAEDEANQIMAGYRMFAALADVSVDVILELDMEDLAALGPKVAPLMGKSAVAAMAEIPAAPSPGAT